MSSQRTKLGLGNKNDDIGTPSKLLEQIRLEFGELYDPCPLAYTTDGLSLAWPTDKVAFVNPPFSDVRSWVNKALTEVNRGVTVVMLLTARVNSRYWNDLVYPNASELRFICGEVVFEGYKNGFPIPIALAIFKPNKRTKISSHRYGPYKYTRVASSE